MADMFGEATVAPEGFGGGGVCAGGAVQVAAVISECVAARIGPYGLRFCGRSESLPAEGCLARMEGESVEECAEF